MRKKTGSDWWGVSRLVVRADDANLEDLAILYRKWRLTALFAAATCSGLRTHWLNDNTGNKLRLFTSVPDGTWIKSPGEEQLLPLTQGELCADECRMLKEFLGYEYKDLLNHLTHNS